MASGNPKKRKSVSPDPKDITSKKRKQRAESPSTSSKKKSSGAQDSKGCGIFAKLIDSGVVSDHETVYYLRKRDKSVMKEGQITHEGVLCNCCGDLFLLSKFEVHAGSGLHRPSANMFLPDGRSIMQCQQAAEGGEVHSETTSRRSRDCLSSHDTSISQLEDKSDNICQICGDGGQLMLCDSCPSAFHAECLYLDAVPEGDWHCPRCRCGRCGSGIGLGSHQKDASKVATMLSCAQCQVPYHRDCVQTALQQEFEGHWFCTENCKHVFKKLRRLVGRVFPLEKGLSWMLVRSFKEDGEPMIKNAAARSFEKQLSEALKVLQQCFDPIVDYETRVDLLSQTSFNRKSNVRRLDCSGFYTMLLTKGEQLVSVATVRTHGKALAEMPFIATRYEFRQQGMCKTLMKALETMLRGVGVYKLILPSISELLETWTSSFGFKSMSLQERKQVSDLILLSFPGTTLLHKSLLRPEVVPCAEPVLDTAEARGQSSLIRFKVKLLPPDKAASSVQPISCH